MAPETLAPDRAKRHYRTRGPVTRAIRAIFRSSSDEAAHQRQLKIERDFFELATLQLLHGHPEALIAYQVRLNDLLCSQGAVPTIRTAMRSEGAAGRLQDDSSERVIHEIATGSTESLSALEHRTRLQIGELYQVLLACRQRKAVLR